MKYRVDKDKKIPAYLQLYEQIRSDVTGGVYGFGAKLPSKRLLAEESGCSVITVEHTYSILAEEGYIEARHRSGYFVIYREDDFLSNAEVTRERDAVPSNHSTKVDFPFSVLSKTMRKVLLDYGERILIKSPNHGTLALRKAISSYLARAQGMNVLPEQIIIGAGAEYLYSLIVQLIGTERPYALENPSYEAIRRVYKAGGAECEMLKMGGDGIRSSELEKSLAGVLHVTPFNSCPSHVSANASKRAEYIQWAKKREAVIIEDNYDSELTVSTKNEETLFSLAPAGRVIYLNTFSKTVAPSMRVGYMVLPEDMLGAFDERVGFYSCTVPVFEQYVLAELISGGDFERHINKVRRARRRAMSK